MYTNFARDTAYEAMRCTDETCEKIRNRKLANTAWNEFQQSADMGAYSVDFARGFKDGYADYLFAGGTGEAQPPLPECYWGVRYQTPQGYQAIQDWFTGFRHGVVAAQQSGMREFMVFPVPYTDPDGGSLHPYPIPPGSPARLMPPAPMTPDQIEKTLPAPTPIQPGQTSDLRPPKQVRTILAEQRAHSPQPASYVEPRGTKSAEKPRPD